MAKIKTDRLMLEYDAFGDSKDPAVILVMGLGTQMTAWSPDFCQALAAQKLYVVRFDNRDIGLSEKMAHHGIPPIKWMAVKRRLGINLSAPYSLYDMAEDTLSLMNALSIERAHVVGASMGGMISQILATRYPARVLSLTSIMSTTNNNKFARISPRVLKQIVSRPKTKDPEKILDFLVKGRQMIASPRYPRSDEEWRAMIKESAKRSTYPQGYFRQLAAVIATPDRSKEMRTIQAPTLVIHGNADPLVPLAAGKDTARHIPNSRLEVIDGMGHDFPPELVGEITGMIGRHIHAAADSINS